jgi:hypothetical protein
LFVIKQPLDLLFPNEKKFAMKGKGWFIAMAITVALVYTGFVYLIPWY